MARSSFLYVVVGILSAADRPAAVDLCRVLAAPARYADMVITVRGTVRSSMHGTYLTDASCDQPLFIALPTEIPNFNGSVKIDEDANFEVFQRARFDYRADAPSFAAAFTGRLQYAKRGKGFGYYGRNRARLIVSRVSDITQGTPSAQRP